MNRKTWIYEISFIGSDRKYVGQTSSKNPKVRLDRHLKDLIRCKHQNQIMQNNFNKLGEDSFWTRILDCVDYEARDEAERIWMINLGAHVSSGGMNLRDPLTYEMSEETKIKIANGGKGNKNAVGSKSRTGLKHTEATKQKISNSHIGKKNSDLARKKISEFNKGRKQTEEHKNKISEANKGKTLSEETKQKMSVAAKQRCINSKNKINQLLETQPEIISSSDTQATDDKSLLNHE